MKRKSDKKIWVIQGFDGTTKLFEHTIDVGQISAPKLQELLKTLTAKISLTEREIIRDYAKRGTRAHTSFLEVTHLQGGKFGYSCGTNPYVIAIAEHVAVL